MPALVMLTGAVTMTGLSLTMTPADAAVLTLDQCNNVGPGPAGATTGMTCTVTVVNTISNGTTSSTTTLTRQCSLDVCPSGNGTFTSSSTSLVTVVNQCNSSDNDAAHPITCSVDITNNISVDTPGAAPVTTVSTTSITVAGLTCAIPADKSADVNAKFKTGDTAQIRCELVSGTNTLAKIEKRR
mgnify:CR=1 FL=1